jgi:hypothetical protein
MPSFDRMRYRRHDAAVFLYVFDLIELSALFMNLNMASPSAGSRQKQLEAHRRHATAQ